MDGQNLDFESLGLGLGLTLLLRRAYVGPSKRETKLAHLRQPVNYAFSLQHTSIHPETEQSKPNTLTAHGSSLSWVLNVGQFLCCVSKKEKH